MKLSNVWNSFLKEDNRQQNKKGKKIFYSLDINVAGDKGRFKAKGEGIVLVSAEEAQRLMTIEDVIVFVIEEETGGMVKSSGKYSSKDLLKEMLVSFVVDKDEAKEYTTRTDKILFSFDYGNAVEDSAGLIITKIENSSEFSVVMRYNGNVQNAEFNKITINKQIQFFSREGE